MKKDLYLMRHGQTLFNVRRKIQGWCDSPLTELGKQQALNAKENLKGISFDHYYIIHMSKILDGKDGKPMDKWQEQVDKVKD